MYYVYGVSGPSLLTESTDSMIMSDYESLATYQQLSPGSTFRGEPFTGIGSSPSSNSEQELRLSAESLSTIANSLQLVIDFEGLNCRLRISTLKNYLCHNTQNDSLLPRDNEFKLACLLSGPHTATCGGTVQLHDHVLYHVTLALTHMRTLVQQSSIMYQTFFAIRPLQKNNCGHEIQ